MGIGWQNFGSVTAKWLRSPRNNTNNAGNINNTTGAVNNNNINNSNGARLDLLIPAMYLKDGASVMGKGTDFLSGFLKAEEKLPADRKPDSVFYGILTGEKEKL